jgi:hypothetical protein
MLGKLFGIIMMVGAVCLLCAGVYKANTLDTTPGQHVPCYDKFGNMIQDTICWDAGMIASDVRAQREEIYFFVIFISTMFGIVGYGLYVSD